MISKLMSALVAVLFTLLAIGALYTKVLSRMYTDLKTERNLCVKQVQGLHEQVQIAELKCKQRVQLIRDEQKVEVEVPKKIKKKIDKGENYEILASPDTKPYFDGTGWVFPETK